MKKPTSVIRKISVGLEYKTGMTYMTGQKILNDKYSIILIQREDVSGNIVVYIQNEEKEVLLWKEFTPQVPINIEYYIEYEVAR